MKIPTALKAFVFALCYGFAFLFLQYFFSKTGFLIKPDTHNLVSWDAGYYKIISESGYDERSESMGFFILFPLIWKMSMAGVWGVVYLNIVLFAAGFALLCSALEEKDNSLWLLWLTLPSVFFAFVPYSEATFFFFGSMIVYALRKRKNGLLWIALFLISLVRATGVFLIPAFLAAELLSNPARLWWRSVLVSLYRHALPMLLALGLFIVWQYHQTGIWFAYFKKQAQHWGHTFSWPGLPFSNIENAESRYHWLSALALLIDVVALSFIIWQGLRWLKGRDTRDKDLLVSAGYLTMVLISVLLLNPKYGGTNTMIMGAHRYTFATPFLFVFVQFWYRQQLTWKQILLFMLLANGFFLLFGTYDLQNKFTHVGAINNLLLLAFLLYARFPKRYWLVMGIVSINFFMQMHYFQQFISLLYPD
ncbi:MAG: hypothetical protein EOO03_15365 [Chitinophagaceae bacterium]|nr:MAG: hypothetical protein EOO03_15365 [Chitinophagaceae bacterium]